MVGLIPLFAVETLEPEAIDKLPGFKRRMQWFIDNHPDVPDHIDMSQSSARGIRLLLSLVEQKTTRPRPLSHAGRIRISVSLWHQGAVALP